MNFKTIGGKINISIMSISLISLAIAFLVLFYMEHKTEVNTYNSITEDLKAIAKVKIDGKKSIGLTNAFSISGDADIEKALDSNDRQYAIDSLVNTSKNFKKHTKYKNIKIHLHTKENKSFVRSWKISKFGDDLSSFRASVVKVNSSNSPVNTFEVGNAGLSLRSVVPVWSNDKKQLGSLEFMQGLNSVAKAFDKSHLQIQLLSSS